MLKRFVTCEVGETFANYLPPPSFHRNSPMHTSGTMVPSSGSSPSTSFETDRKARLIEDLLTEKRTCLLHM